LQEAEVSRLRRCSCKVVVDDLVDSVERQYLASDITNGRATHRALGSHLLSGVKYHVNTPRSVMAKKITGE
jgi:hypothetical protein